MNICYRCEDCGKVVDYKLRIIDKQIAGEFKRLHVCVECYITHQKNLEMTRENFQRQFGGGYQ